MISDTATAEKREAVEPSPTDRDSAAMSRTVGPDGQAAWWDWEETEFQCQVVSSGDWVVLALTGVLDIAHATGVRKALLDLQLRRGGGLALDLRDMSFMDSTGVRLVLLAMRHAEEHHADFAVIPGSGAVQRVLELVGLAEQLPMVDDIRLLQ
jgi:anti-sigma B factor antagonist